MDDATANEDGGKRTGLFALVLAAIAAATLTAFAYWPGLMSWDPIRQYDEALSGDITDWHPPIMQWLWQRLIPIHAGPLPMMLLQIGLYWGGLLLLAVTMQRRGRPIVAWALLACGLLPMGMALTGAILKDSLMAGALLAASGLLTARGGRGAIFTGLIAAVLLFFAAALRFNGFLAALPLLVALLPAPWRHGPLRMSIAAVVGAAALLATMPLVNRLIGAEPSGVTLSLLIFDVGGITEHSGVNMFPPAIAVPDAVRINHGCYRPNKWDSYSDWVDPECPLGFTAWRKAIAAGTLKPYSVWLAAVAAHPIAYAEHRLAHFAINTRLVPVADAVERPVPVVSVPNIWGFRIGDNAVKRGIDALAVATAHTPLGWPVVWIGLAFGALVAGGRGTDARLIVPLALSSLLYGCGYLVFSVAAELRYHLWTGLAALLATVLVAADARAISRRHLCWAYAPAGLIILIALAMRL